MDLLIFNRLPSRISLAIDADADAEVEVEADADGEAERAPALAGSVAGVVGDGGERDQDGQCADDHAESVGPGAAAVDQERPLRRADVAPCGVGAAGAVTDDEDGRGGQD
jgi:hypothetical protein